MSAIEQANAYHEHTKHYLDRFADYLGHFDWDNRPEPFRNYDEAPRIPLPIVAESATAAYNDLYEAEPTRQYPITLETIACLFELGLGLAAWKKWGERIGAVRCDPSSGNLHPTEGYLIAADIPDIAAGVHHYHSHDHCLETRCTFTSEDAAAVAAALPADSVLVGMTSIYWRESWKYGVRAFRYCQLDMGHVIGSLRYAAAVLGWHCRLVLFESAQMAGWLGLDRDGFVAGEEEHVEGFMVVTPNPVWRTDGLAPHLSGISDALSAATGKGEWHGQPRQLSPEHHPWPPIDKIAAASTQDSVEVPGDPGTDTLPPPASPPTAIGATKIIRQRRSSIDLDGETHLGADAFYIIMDRSLHRTNVAPFDSLCWAPTCDLVMFVHRVEDLEAGLYFLHRSAVALEDLQAALKSSFTWEKPANAPAHIGFYHLASGDYREQSQTVSCRQEIAGDGAFSLGILADFHASIERFGANAYRRMHWEAGLIGQLLYLEAEAAGIRGTGMGCFFDEPVHEIFDLSGGAYQSIYHFTMGNPREDDRILDRAPYDHLKGRAHASIDPGDAGLPLPDEQQR